MRITRRGLLTASAAAALLPGSALSHRAKAALTMVTWAPRSHLLEVVHRLHTHDAEVALQRAAGVATPNLSEPEFQARLALYVEPRFALSLARNSADDEAGIPVPLTLLGAEMQGDSIYVYQEAGLEMPPPAMLVRNDLLRDVFPEQQNQVNLDMGLAGTAGIRTLVFAGNDAWKRASFAG